MIGQGIRFTPPERGAALVEYSIILALIAVVALAVVGSVGLEVQAFFDQSPLDLSGLAPWAPSP